LLPHLTGAYLKENLEEIPPVPLIPSVIWREEEGKIHMERIASWNPF